MSSDAISIVLSALKDYPAIQWAIAALISYGGYRVIKRGESDGSKIPLVATSHDEDKRAQWMAYNQLKNIEENSFEMIELMKANTAALNRLADLRWNKSQ